MTNTEPTPDTSPEAVEAMCERLAAYRPQNEWGDGVRHVICDEAAAMLRAVAGERDTWRDLESIPHRRLEAAEAEAAALREALRDEIVMAYEQGALDVHRNWQEDRDPDFSEAASDYAASRALKENHDGL